MAEHAALVAAILGGPPSDDVQIVQRLRRLVRLALRRRSVINLRSVLNRAELLAAMPCRWRPRVRSLLPGLLRVMDARGELRLLTGEYVTCYGDVRQHALPTWIGAPVGGPVLVAQHCAKTRRQVVAAWRQSHPDGVVVERSHSSDPIATGAA
jgi:hypothetical protein